jgi:hypothetical protein
MKTFQEFLLIIKEMKGDYGSGEMPPKPKCYGKTTTYAMLPGKKVCKFKRKR